MRTSPPLHEVSVSLLYSYPASLSPHSPCRFPPLQAYISRPRIDSFSLTADMMYVSQNAPRIMRALFEICLR